MSTERPKPINGQPVIIKEARGHYARGLVDRTTATQVHLQSGGRYRLDNGRQVGSAGQMSWATAAWPGCPEWEKFSQAAVDQGHRKRAGLVAWKLQRGELTPETLRALAVDLAELATAMENVAKDREAGA